MAIYKRWTIGSGHDSRESAKEVAGNLRKSGKKAKVVKTPHKKKWHIFYR
jgi:hypothetical protein